MSKGACGSCIARVPHPSGDWCRGRARQQCPSVCDWQTRRRRARGALSQHFAAASDTSTVLVHLLRVYRVCVVHRNANEGDMSESFAEPPKDEQVYLCVPVPMSLSGTDGLHAARVLAVHSHVPRVGLRSLNGCQTISRTSLSRCCKTHAVSKQSTKQGARITFVLCLGRTLAAC